MCKVTWCVYARRATRSTRPRSSWTRTRGARTIRTTTATRASPSSTPRTSSSSSTRWTRCALCTCGSRSTPLHFTPLHSTPLHYTPLHSTPLHSTPLHSTTLHYTPLHSTPLHYTPLHSTKLHYTNTPLHYTTLHYTTLIVSAYRCWFWRALPLSFDLRSRSCGSRWAYCASNALTNAPNSNSYPSRRASLPRSSEWSTLRGSSSSATARAPTRASELLPIACSPCCGWLPEYSFGTCFCVPLNHSH